MTLNRLFSTAFAACKSGINKRRTSPRKKDRRLTLEQMEARAMFSAHPLGIAAACDVHGLAAPAQLAAANLQAEHGAAATAAAVPSLTATPVSSSEIDLAWTAVNGAAAYVVAEVIDGQWEEIGSVGGGTTGVPVQNLSPGTGYYFDVAAYTASGYQWGAYQYATTFGNNAPPAAPSWTATPVSGSEIDLAWNAASGAAGYAVAEVVNGQWQVIGTVGGGATSVPVENLSPGTSYYFDVAAYNSAGATWGNYQCVATLGTNAPPAAPSWTATAVSGSEIDLAWNAVSGAAGYAVAEVVNGQWQVIGNVGGGATSVPVQNLSPGTSYYFDVAAYNSAGATWGNYQCVATLGTNAPPAAPSWTATPVSGSEIDLAWNAVGGASGYAVAELVNGQWQDIGNVGGSATSFPVQNLSPGTSYYFDVAACNSAGATWGTYQSATTLGNNGNNTPPAAPSWTGTPVSGSEIDFTWNAVSGATGYAFAELVNGQWQEIGSVEGSTASFSVHNLSPATSYYFDVAAYNSAGATWGTYQSITTLANGGTSNFLGLQDSALAALVQNLDASGSITRNDMIQILDSVAAKGPVSAADFSDLQTIVADATQLNMPGYVQVLATDVIDGNTANAHYQGQALGDLEAGSSAAALNDLVGKWFLGTDHPAIDDNVSYFGSATYQLAGGSLFVGTPSHFDLHQGYLGDCYYLSTLGSIANHCPASIENMFLDNGDGTYTVRFYANGKADYVTVDRMLATAANGNLVYDGQGFACSSASNVLWPELAEKAYAQWNETGNNPRGNNTANSYAGIDGGYETDVFLHVLNQTATEVDSLTGAEQTAINAINSGMATTVGTIDSSNSDDSLPYGMYGDHAYVLVSYNSASGTFTVFNPWGKDQPPSPLTWAQLTQDCDDFTYGDPTIAGPISASRTAAHDAALAGMASAGSAGGFESHRGTKAATDLLMAEWARC